MANTIRIGTRESQLAVWQATKVQELLAQHGVASKLVYIKSEGDIDLQTPLYEMGVQGIFTKSLDIALLQNKIDIAVHSMKDVPTVLAKGIVQAAVLERASYKDLFVYRESAVVNSEWSMVNGQSSMVNGEWSMGNVSADALDRLFTTHDSAFTIATSSIRRKAQWLNRYPHHQLDNLRGNVNTRLRKVAESNWQGAIFAAAGLERIGLRPAQSIELDWMLPAPAQGAIMVVCRQGDTTCLEACSLFNDSATALCTKLERDFLKVLQGGCSTPISALAQVKDDAVFFKGNILSVDGKQKMEVELQAALANADGLGEQAARQLLAEGGDAIVNEIRNAAR